MAIDKRTQSLIEDGYPKEFVEGILGFSDLDVTKKVDALMSDLTAEDSKDELAVAARKEKGPKPKPSPDGIPHVYFIGGQPGAGKSSAMKKVSSREEARNGAVNVEMDAYREMHPDIKKIKEAIDRHYAEPRFAGLSEEEIARRKSSDLVAFTQDFADKVADRYKETLFKNGYNIAIESTLRHSSTVFSWATKFKEMNPECVVSVIMVGVSREIAYRGTEDRANQMLVCTERMRKLAVAKGREFSTVSRGFISRDYYDSVCDDLGTSMDELASPEMSHLIDGNVEIVDRKGTVNYDRNEEAKKPSPKSAGDVERSSLSGAIAKEQEATFAKELADDKAKGVKRYFGVEAYFKEHKTEVMDMFETADEDKALQTLKDQYDKEVEDKKGKTDNNTKASYNNVKATMDSASLLRQAVVSKDVQQSNTR